MAAAFRAAMREKQQKTSGEESKTQDFDADANADMWARAHSALIEARKVSHDLDYTASQDVLNKPVLSPEQNGEKKESLSRS